MKKFAILFFLLSLAVSSRGAEVYDLIYLRDGSVLNGYISEQQMNGNICITFMSATYSLPKDKVKVVNGGRSVSTEDYEYDNVELLETGDVVTFKVDFSSPKTLSTRVSEIVRTERAVVDHIIDIVVTKDEHKPYEGHIVEVINGKQIKLMSLAGEMIVIRQDNVSQQRRKSDEESVPILISSPIIETYFLKDGTSDEGLLVGQNFETGIVEFLSNTGYKSKWNISEVSRVERARNPKYKEPDDITVKVNHMPFMMWQSRIDKGIVCFASQLSKNIGNAKAGTVEIEMTRNIFENMVVLMPFNPLDIERNSSYIKAFSLSDIESDEIDGKKIREGGKTVTMAYKLEPGYYILYDKELRHILPLWIY